MEEEGHPEDPWTQRELKLLHDMVQDYDRAKYFRKQILWWLGLIIGLPALVLTVSEPIVRLWRLLKGV